MFRLLKRWLNQAGWSRSERSTIAHRADCYHAAQIRARNPHNATERSAVTTATRRDYPRCSGYRRRKE